MFFWKKGGEKVFLKYSNKIKKLLERGDYDRAIARYNKFERFYRKLPMEKKRVYESEYRSLLNQLLIYTKIEELGIIVKGDNTDLMRENLTYLDFLINSTPYINSNYLEFVKSKHQGFVSRINYKLTLNELNERIEEVYDLRDEGNYDGALGLFPKLMRKYKELEKYSFDVDGVYERLIKLRDELKMKLLETRAYSPVAEINIKTLRKSLKNRETKSAREIHRRMFG